MVPIKLIKKFFSGEQELFFFNFVFNSQGLDCSNLKFEYR